MKKSLTFLLFTSISILGYSQVHELSKEKCQSEIEYYWKNSSYKKAVKNVSKICLSNPNNAVSLRNLYYLRQNISKNNLKKALDKLNDENKLTDYAKSLEIYVENEQVKEGNQFYDFEAFSKTNEKFIFSDYANGKDVLLIFDGLDCISEDARKYLIDLYGKLDKNKVEIISFFYVSDIEELSRMVNEFNINWIAISDYKKNHSKTKIIYDAQATPTCVYINSQGKVLINQPGIRQKTVKLLEENIIK